MAKSIAKNWCFTLNNYTEGYELLIKALYPDSINYLIYGHEIAPTTGTPHLQGYVQFTKKLRLTGIKKLFGPDPHFEVAAGTPAQNKAYCSKGTDIVELGLPVIPGSALQGTNQLYNQIIQCNTWNDVIQLPEIHNHVNYAREVWTNKPIMKQEGVILRPWQQHLFDLIMAPPDDRSIIWVYDPMGSKGKTFFAKYMMTNYNAFYCSPSKSTDILHSYNNQSIILYDIPRSVDEDYLNYGAIEKLKDGIVFSGKYNSGTKLRVGNAHVVIFSNSKPLDCKFSVDRLKLFDVESNTLDQIKHMVYDEELDRI